MNPWGMTFSQESGVQGVEDLWVVDVGYRALLFVVLFKSWSARSGYASPIYVHGQGRRMERK